MFTRKILNKRDFSAFCLSSWFLGFSEFAWAQNKRILIVGDSLSAEYGLKRGAGWVALLQARLKEQKFSQDIINASISGETTSGGRSRLPTLLKQHAPSHVIIELGGNDALRGLPLAMTLSNLKQMTQDCQASKAKVLLLGMQMPPNYGADYAKQFAQAYETIAREKKVPLVRFFLKGVGDAAEPLKFFQTDRIHPNEAAQSIMLDNVWSALKKML